MLGELLTSIEAGGCDLEPIASVNDLGDDGASLDCYFVCRIADQCVGHLRIMPERHLRRTSDCFPESVLGRREAMPVLASGVERRA